MSDYEHIWVLEGTLHTRHGAAVQTALRDNFPLLDDPEEEGTIAADDTRAVVYWRTTAPMTWNRLARTLHTAAPDATGKLTVTFPYADDSSPAFLVFHADRVAIHGAHYVMDDKPFLQWDYDHIPPSPRPDAS